MALATVTPQHIKIGTLWQAFTGTGGIRELTSVLSVYEEADVFFAANPATWIETLLAAPIWQNWIATNLNTSGPYSRDALINQLYANTFGSENSQNPAIPTLAAVKAALPAGTTIASAVSIIKAFVDLPAVKTVTEPAVAEYLSGSFPGDTQKSIFDAPTNVNLGGSDSIIEDSKGATVGKINVTDPNGYDAGNLKFAIIGGADAAKFQIVNGELRLKAGESFDFETDADKLAQVIVRVTDSSNRFVDKTFNLNIVDAVEPPGPQSSFIGLTTNTDVLGPSDLSPVDDLVVGFRSISGVNSTVNAGDTVLDGSSTDNDTLKISSETLVGPKFGPYSAIDVFNVTTDKIENIVVDNDSGRRMDIDALNMKGVKFYESNGSGSLEGGTNGDGNAVKFFNITETSGLSLVNTCADLIASYKDSVLAGATTIQLKLENAGDMCDGVDVCIEPDKTGKQVVETIEITSKAGPNFISDLNGHENLFTKTGLNTVIIKGDGDLKIGEPDAKGGMMPAPFIGGDGWYVDYPCAPGTSTMLYHNPFLKTVDGSAATGDLDLLVADVADPATKLTVKTGTGDDTIRLGKIVAGTAVDGGDGHDVIAITQNHYNGLESLFTAIPATAAVAAWDSSSSTKGSSLGEWAKNIEVLRFDGPVGGADLRDPKSILDVANLSGINCIEITELNDGRVYDPSGNLLAAPAPYQIPAINIVQIPVGESFKVCFDKPEDYCGEGGANGEARRVPRKVEVECPLDWIKQCVGNTEQGWELMKDDGSAWNYGQDWDPSWGDYYYKEACDGDRPFIPSPDCVANLNVDFGKYDYTKKLGKFVGPDNDPGNSLELCFEDKPSDDPEWARERTLLPENWQVNLSGRELAHLNINVDQTSANAVIWVQAGNDEDERLDNLNKLEDIIITGGSGNGAIVFDGNGEKLSSLTLIDASAVVDMDVQIFGLENAANGMDILTGGGNDYVSGTNKADNISTDGGDDIAHGNGGADLIDLGTGNDRGFGGDGDDKLFGQDGIDCLHGDDGNDCLDGGLDADLMTGGYGCDVFVVDITKSDIDFYDVLLDANDDGVIDNSELVCDDCYIDVITDFQPGLYYIDEGGHLAARSEEFDKIVFTFEDESDVFVENPDSPYEWCIEKEEFKNFGNLFEHLNEKEALYLACNFADLEFQAGKSVVVFGIGRDTYVQADTDGDGHADQAVKLLGVYANDISECDFAPDCDRAFGH